MITIRTEKIPVHLRDTPDWDDRFRHFFRQRRMQLEHEGWRDVRVFNSLIRGEIVIEGIEPRKNH